MNQTLLWIIIAIVIADFLFEKILDYLNYMHLQDELPASLEGIYEPEKYLKSQQYEKASSKFSLVSSSFSTILILLMLALGGFGLISDYVSSLTENIYFQTLLFFGILGFSFDLLSLPFQLYSTFVIENRFGFNKSSMLLFFTDKLKSWGLGIILGGLIISFLLWAWLSTGIWFWLIVVGGLSAFSLFMTLFYSRLIVPLFNKQTPLEDGELKQSIDKFAMESGFQLDQIYLIDGSKRSTKANAYFSGLGKKKRIVLYDTLVNDLETEEIVAVLAHEIGHNKRGHIVKGLFMSLFQTALMVWLLSLAVERPELSAALGSNEAKFYLGIIAFGLLYTPISFMTAILSNMISRRFEYEADQFANQHHDGNILIQALIKLSSANLSNLLPHPAYVFFHYSHPTLLQRKKAIEDSNK